MSLFVVLWAMVILVIVVCSRLLVAGFGSSTDARLGGAFSLWLSGWFKLTERIQRGESALGGWVFLMFFVGWSSFAAVELGRSDVSIDSPLLALGTIGLVTFFFRCIPVLNRQSDQLTRFAWMLHVVVGATVVLSRA